MPMMRLSQSVLGCHRALLATLTYLTGLVIARALGVSAPEALFIRKAAAVRQIRVLAADSASSRVILVAESHKKKGSLVATLPFHRFGVRVELASSSSSSSNRESEDTSCTPRLPCSSCSISCSLNRVLLAGRLDQFNKVRRGKRFKFN